VLRVLNFEKNSDYGFVSLAAEWENLRIKKPV
jgi:hypothetical protein